MLQQTLSIVVVKLTQSGKTNTDESLMNQNIYC